MLWQRDCNSLRAVCGVHLDGLLVSELARSFRCVMAVLTKPLKPVRTFQGAPFQLLHGMLPNS